MALNGNWVGLLNWRTRYSGYGWLALPSHSDMASGGSFSFALAVGLPGDNLFFTLPKFPEVKKKYDARYTISMPVQ